jgi:hypothetical protein
MKMVNALAYLAMGYLLLASCVTIVVGDPTTAPVEPDLALQPAPVLSPPPKQYANDKRRFQGIPGIERAPHGRLWAAWYAGGSGEGAFNYIMLSTSGDNGATWSDVKLVIDPPGDVRAFDPDLWLDPTGKLWLTWAQGWTHWDGRGGVWAITTQEPDAENPKWTAPRRLFNGVMMNKPVVLSNGQWVFPGCVWDRNADKRPAGQSWNLPDERFSTLMVTADGGETFKVLGRPDVPQRTFDEHSLIERKDGSLWTLVRTKYGIGQSTSTDGGKTWSPGEATNIRSPSTRFFIRRLASGKLLLVQNLPPANSKNRSHLTARLSNDDGKTWSDGLLLDERNGVSYPDGTQAPDGTIYIIYDHGRTKDKEILLASFTEADVEAGKIVSPQGRLRVTVNQATGSSGKMLNKVTTPGAALRDNADGAALLAGPSATIDGATPVEFKVGATLFSDRLYRAKELPESLKGMRYLPQAIEGGWTIHSAKGGIIYVITPLADRNKDSMATALLEAGFEKSNIPEFNLFGTTYSNVCCVFQKKLMPDETIYGNQWGIVLLPAK